MPFRINFFFVKVFLTDCQLNKIGKFLLTITMVNLMILYSLLMVSINCSVHVVFETWLESPENPGYFKKSWCFGWFRGNLKTTNLGKGSRPLPRGSLNAKVSQILSMVGSTIPYSPFERAVARPKLNAMQYCYGVGSNFITGAPPEFEDLLILPFCMKSKFNDPKCVILKWGFTQSDLPDQIRNETSIHMRITK